MAKIKKESIVEFNGNFKGLVVKINGVIVFPDKLKKSNISAELRKDQIDHINAAKFAKCVNEVPILKTIWKQKRTTKYTTIDKHDKTKGEYKEKSKFGKAAAFNKILSSNKKEITKLGRPGINNIIVPVTDYHFPYFYTAIFNSEGVDIVFKIPADSDKEIFNNQGIIPVGIFCFHEPRKENINDFEMISKYYTIDEFTPIDKYIIHFPMTAEDNKTIKNYKSCIFYFTIAVEAKGIYRTRGYRNAHGVEFSMEGFPKKSIGFGTERKME